MNNTIPDPIRNHLLLYKIALIVFGAIGFMLGLACADKIVFLLTAAIILLGGLKLKGLRDVAKRGDYKVISGVILADSLMHRKHGLTIKTQQDEEVSIVLSGRPSFAVGSVWTIYVSQEEQEISKMNLPRFLMPARTLLGRYQQTQDNP